MAPVKDSDYKEVYFFRYCPTCKHEKCKNEDEPCNECLDQPISFASHKPMKYEADEKKVKKNG